MMFSTRLCEVNWKEVEKASQDLSKLKQEQLKVRFQNNPRKLSLAYEKAWESFPFSSYHK